jgi:NAD(P)-dependent dehydrogenase (short-subunit alcohol dehydrogenase family)
MGLLDHKTAVITGANSGIGLATATRFIAEGPNGCSLPAGGNPNLALPQPN